MVALLSEHHLKNLNLCVIFSFLCLGMRTKNAPHWRLDPKDRCRAGSSTPSSLPALFLFLLNLYQLLLESQISGPSQASRHGRSGNHSFWPSNFQLPSLPKKSETLLLEWFRKWVCAPKTKRYCLLFVCLFYAMEHFKIYSEINY